MINTHFHLYGYNLVLEHNHEDYIGVIVNCDEENEFKSQPMRFLEDVERWGRMKIYKLCAQRNYHPTILCDDSYNIIYANHAAKESKNLLDKLKYVQYDKIPPNWDVLQQTLIGGIYLISFHSSIFN